MKTGNLTKNNISAYKESTEVEPIVISQTTGESTTEVMSQSAVTTALQDTYDTLKTDIDNIPSPTTGPSFRGMFLSSSSGNIENPKTGDTYYNDAVQKTFVLNTGGLWEENSDVFIFGKKDYYNEISVSSLNNISTPCGRYLVTIDASNASLLGLQDTTFYVDIYTDQNNTSALQTIVSVPTNITYQRVITSNDTPGIVQFIPVGLFKHDIKDWYYEALVDGVLPENNENAPWNRTRTPRTSWSYIDDNTINPLLKKCVYNGAVERNYDFNVDSVNNVATVTGKSQFPSLTDIVIPSEFQNMPVTAIAESSFNVANSPDITSIVIPDSVTNVGSYAFKDQIKVHTAVINGTDAVYESQAFYNMGDGSAGSTLTINSSIKLIEGSAFSRCNFETVDFYGTIEEMDTNCFGYLEKTKYLTFHSALGVLPKQSLYGLDSLETITFKSTVQRFSRMMSLYLNLKHFDLPEQVELEGECFNQSFLESVTIPDSATIVEIPATSSADAFLSNPFKGSKQLREFILSPSNTTFKVEDGSLYSFDGTILYHYNVDATEVVYNMPNTVLEVAGSALKSGSPTVPDGNVKKINFSTNLTTIHRAFATSTSLEEVDIPESVNHIKLQAFNNSINIKKIVLRNPNMTIEQDAFHNYYATDGIIVYTDEDKANPPATWNIDLNSSLANAEWRPISEFVSSF